jgi:ferredoxin-NADP reductase
MTQTLVEFGAPIEGQQRTFQVIAVTRHTRQRLWITLVAESPSNFNYIAGDKLTLRITQSGVVHEDQHYRIATADIRTRILNLETKVAVNGTVDFWAASVVPGEPVTASSPADLS